MHVPTDLVLAVELVVRDMSRKVGVKDGAESQSVVPAAAEVRDVDVLLGRRKINGYNFRE